MSSNPNSKLPTKWQRFVQLHPVARPTVAGDFFRLPAWKRSLASIAYCLRRLEYWLSPRGYLREWIRLNTLAAVLVGTLILLSGPIITAILVSILDWANLSVLILVKVMSVVALFPPLLLATISGVFLWRLARQRRGKVRPQQQQQNPNYYE